MVRWPGTLRLSVDRLVVDVGRLNKKSVLLEANQSGNKPQNYHGKSQHTLVFFWHPLLIKNGRLKRTLLLPKQNKVSQKENSKSDIRDHLQPVEESEIL